MDWLRDRERRKRGQDLGEEIRAPGPPWETITYSRMQSGGQTQPGEKRGYLAPNDPGIALWIPESENFALQPSRLFRIVLRFGAASSARRGPTAQCLNTATWTPPDT